MDTTNVLTLAAVVATNLITVVTLYIHSDNKMTHFMHAMQEEMRDFHGRLIAIEERRK